MHANANSRRYTYRTGRRYNAYLPQEKVANFHGTPGALSGLEDDVGTARAQQRIHVGDRAGRGQIS